jgi:hypothetical protein
VLLANVHPAATTPDDCSAASAPPWRPALLLDSTVSDNWIAWRDDSCGALMSVSITWNHAIPNTHKKTLQTPVIAPRV